MKQRRLFALIAGGAIATVALVAAPAAQAAVGAGSTTATFTLAGGAISLTTPDAATLDTWAANPLVTGTSVSDSLGDTTVTDTRNSTAGWTASASSTDFGNGATGTVGKANVTIAIDPLSSITQTVGGVTKALTAGLFVPKPGGTTGAGGSIGSLVGSELTTILDGLGGLLGQNANNAIKYNPTVTINIPRDTPAGTYTGTITQSAS